MHHAKHDRALTDRFPFLGEAKFSIDLFPVLGAIVAMNNNMRIRAILSFVVMLGSSLVTAFGAEESPDQVKIEMNDHNEMSTGDVYPGNRPNDAGQSGSKKTRGLMLKPETQSLPDPCKIRHLPECDE